MAKFVYLYTGGSMPESEEEGKEVMDMEGEAQVLDAALIAAAQRIEHYEIAGYGCAKTFATLLGDQEAEHADDPEHGAKCCLHPLSVAQERRCLGPLIG